MKTVKIYYHANDEARQVSITVEGETAFDAYYELEAALDRSMLSWAKPPTPPPAQVMADVPPIAVQAKPDDEPF